MSRNSAVAVALPLAAGVCLLLTPLVLASAPPPESRPRFGAGYDNRSSPPAAAPRQAPTATPLPPIDPTPHGVPISIGAPLPTPSLASNAIRAHNAHAVAERVRLDPPARDVVGFTRDGQRMITDRDGGSCDIRRMPDGARIGSLEGAQSSNFGPVPISPDGQLLATGNQFVEGNIKLWSLDVGEQMREHRGGQQVRDMAFAAEGHRLVAARSYGDVQVWDVADGTLLANYRAPTGYSGAAVIAVHPGGERIVATAANRGIAVDLRDVDSGEVIRTLTYSSTSTATITRLLYRPDGDALLAATASGIVLWEHDRLVLPGPSAPPDYLTWSPDGQWLAGGGASGDAWVWVWDGHGQVRRIVNEENRRVAGISWSADGSVLAVGLERLYINRPGDWPTETLLWGVDAGRVLLRLPDVVAPVFTPAGDQLVLRGEGSLCLYGVRADVDGALYLPFAAGGR